MSAIDIAEDYTRRLVQPERNRAGGLEPAMRRVGREANVGYWTLWGFWHRRRKRADADTIGRLRAALIRRLEREVMRLEHEIEILRTTGVDPCDDVVAEVEADLARAKAALGLPD